MRFPYEAVRRGCKGMHENEFGRRGAMEYAVKGRHAF
jgi:hypothetical protein